MSVTQTPARAANRSADVAVLRALRTASLLLDAQASPGRSVTDVVRWFGAMQAQDLGSVAWSLGLRTGSIETEVMAAVESGAVLRTWPMRGTLHLVPASDARWMIEHLGQRALRGAERRRQALGLSTTDADRAADVLAQTLTGGGRLTRAECVSVLADAGIPTGGQRAYHLLWYASQRGVTCVGPNRGREQTFVLLDEWAPNPVHLDRASALATIAERFVRSHGPVAPHDLARWADITLTQARAAISAVPDLVVRQFAGTDMVTTVAGLDAAASAPSDRTRRARGHALPGFDELILGYRDRSAQLAPEDAARIVPGGNGVFNPTLVLDGRVVGTWRRRMLAGRVEIVATPFATVPPSARSTLDASLGAYARFVGRPESIEWVRPAYPVDP